MQIILKSDIKGVGYKNDLVDVKPGYGRNYLIPQGLAVLATESNKKVQQENSRQASHKADKLRGDAQATADKIASLAAIEIKTRAGETGKIFGSITVTQLADSLRELGADVDRRKISLREKISTLGTYVADVDLHREVKTTVTFSVIEE